MESINIVTADGFYVTLDDLQADIDKAKSKGLSQKWAFTPETVQALIESAAKDKQNLVEINV